eukprot:TRINITY_DN30296_c0_g1_i1.p1 TRINITY_DN30296_c0_g1~~TRINITY_DN30296_c0_g1_i1.p1  ORF type:complete len:496 (+),score=166.41 TRINITY_DN30296_c0_g1_i1:49-1488(+)
MAAAPAAGVAQFGSFFNKPVEVLLRYRNESDDDEDEYWQYVELASAKKIRADLANIVAKATARPLADAAWAVRGGKFTFVNHGAFGCALPALLEVAEYWRRVQQEQPLLFFDRILFPFLVHSVRRLRRFLSVPAPLGDVLLFPNATYALNCVMKNIAASSTGAHLCVIFDTTYGSVKKMASAYYTDVVKVAVPMDAMRAWKGRSDVVAYLETALVAALQDHKKQYASVTLCLEAISSNTAMKWPVGPLAVALRRCLRREVPGAERVYVMVDAAHELGMTAAAPPVAEYLTAHGVDAWLTNAHKWFACPSGAGLLIFNPTTLGGVMKRPLVVSHGDAAGQSLGSMALWHGHVDYSAWLVLASAVGVWETPAARIAHAQMASLADSAEAMLRDAWGVPSAYAASLTPPLLRLVPVPARVSAFFKGNADALQNHLHHQHAIECPVKALGGALYVRTSAFVYNVLADYKRLAAAVQSVGRAKV